MRYALDLSSEVKRYLKKLRDKKLRQRFLSAVDSLADNPRPPQCKKMAGSHDRYRLRVGDYRIIYEVNDGTITILVLAIGHRREIYD